ncbi:hypothetical protein [Actibacterium sp. 188UL27-1]|uniref:hypothetical protein n=1 Tax=Actibacterium sp. 188UL27-1 TaxID=2786961 RepID=UPI0019571D2F|nr:hypothetical protein [Actibacterium sp. 188UL27-1]MBM7067683.1 hypothetical protein [Actibacterium sp. 188UL27-1]
MPSRRLPPAKITPAHEDMGLFPKWMGRIRVDLIPQMRRNGRRDLIVRGYVKTDQEIEVVFAGRRSRDVEPLEHWLKVIYHRAVRATEAPVNVSDMRCPIEVEGAWRPTFRRDEMGLETRQYQLIAARWSVLGADGRAAAFGEQPSVPPWAL